MTKWKVHASQKLVPFLQAQMGKYSGKFLRKNLLEAQFCRINGTIERFGSRQLMKGDLIEIASNWESRSCDKKIVPEIVYEDDLVQVINKPTGLVCNDTNFAPLYLVHRLDKGTTGLLILAKTKKVKEDFIVIFEKRAVKKKYLAIVDGVMKDQEGECRSLIGKKGFFEGQTIWGSVENQGLEAITRWRCLTRGHNCSLVECEPVTGRTHQIRVHMAEMGHPILGDGQYGKNFRCSFFASRHLLHAAELQFSWQGKGLELKAQVPQDFHLASEELLQ